MGIVWPSSLVFSVKLMFFPSVSLNQTAVAVWWCSCLRHRNVCGTDFGQELNVRADYKSVILELVAWMCLYVGVRYCMCICDWKCLWPPSFHVNQCSHVDRILKWFRDFIDPSAECREQQSHVFTADFKIWYIKYNSCSSSWWNT